MRSLTPELEERIKEELCSQGICFKPDDRLELVATSEDEYLDYVKNFLEDACPCLKSLGLLDLAVDAVASAMFGETVFVAEVDGVEYYVRLA